MVDAGNLTGHGSKPTIGGHSTYTPFHCHPSPFPSTQHPFPKENDRHGYIVMLYSCYRVPHVRKLLYNMLGVYVSCVPPSLASLSNPRKAEVSTGFS